MSELGVEVHEQQGGVIVIALAGVLDKSTAPALESRMRELGEAGKTRFVIDCQRLTHLSSEGMGVFLSHLIKIRKAGGDIKFCAMRQEVQSVLQMLGLVKLLVVKPTQDEAVGEFLGAQAPKPKPKESQKLRIDLEERGQVLVLALHGFVDRHTIGLLEGELSGALQRGQANIVIDCAELTYISSNGMGVFISYVNKARHQGGDIRLCCLRDVARTVITMLGLHRHFEVHEARDAAVASFAAKR